MAVKQSELIGLSATELRDLIASRQVSAREAVAAHIERIEALEPKLHAVVVPLFEQALLAAEAADRTSPDGKLLHGVPVTVKESFEIRGTPSTLGASARRNDRAENDADLVTKLRNAGAIVVAKTNVPQLLLYVEADNPLYGRTNNPWNLERSPGGSSGGEAAAVAAGYSVLGLGTDIGGSIRVPAHCCGLQSLKPTPGLLSLNGSAAATLFERYAIADAAGPLARTVGDLRLAMAALGAPVNEISSVRDRTIGVYDDDGYFPASAAVRRAVGEAATALAAAGCQIKQFAVPEIDEALRLFYGLLTVDGGDGPKAFMHGSTYDARIEDLLRLASLNNSLRAPFGSVYRLLGQQRIAHLLQWSGRRSKDQVDRLVADLDAYRRRFLGSIAALDVLICPPCSVPAVTHGATQALGPASVNYTMLFNVLAWPAGVVAATRVRQDEEAGRPGRRDRVDEAARRVDLGSAGLPVGIQVVARPGREDLVLAVMAELERRLRERPNYPMTPVTPGYAGVGVNGRNPSP